MRSNLAILVCLVIYSGCASRPDRSFVRPLLTQQSMDAVQDSILFGEGNPWQRMAKEDLISFLGQPDEVELVGTNSSTLSIFHYYRNQKDNQSPDRKWRQVDYQFCFSGQRMYDSRWAYAERFSKGEYNRNNYLLTNPFLDITPTNIVAATFRYKIWGMSDTPEPTTDSLSLTITNTEEIVSLCMVAAKLKNCDPLPPEVSPCACGFSSYATIDFWQRATDTDGQSSPSTVGDAVVSISLCSSPHSPPNTKRTVVLLSEHEDFKDKRIISPSEELTLLCEKLTRKYLPNTFARIGSIFSFAGPQNIIQQSDSPNPHSPSTQGVGDH